MGNDQRPPALAWAFVEELVDKDPGIAQRRGLREPARITSERPTDSQNSSAGKVS
jgi:hypothetical protein